MAGPTANNIGRNGDNVPEMVRKMASFPPLEWKSSGDKLKVYIGVGIVRIEQISPADSSWKIRVQTDTYYDQAYCEISGSAKAACDAGRLGTAGLYFATVDDVLNPDGVTVNSQMNAPKVFEADYKNGACLAFDYTDMSLILVKNFVPTYFPFESYLLQFGLTAVFSNETVELVPLDTTPSDTMFVNSMPPGWSSENGVTCTATTKASTLKMRGAEARQGAGLHMSQLVCSVVVSFVDDSWFLTAFIFWLVTMAVNMLMGVGSFGAAKTPRELEEALVARGAFSSSLVRRAADGCTDRPAHTLHAHTCTGLSSSF